MFILPSDAGVVTGAYVNGVYLPSDGQNLAFGLPTNLLIEGNNGAFLFTFNLVTDLSQNPDEFTIGDSLSVRFFQDDMGPMEMPEDFDSQVYHLTNSFGTQTIGLERVFTTLGLFEGGMTIHLNNSKSSFASPFLPGGYESDPTFHFRLVVDQLAQQNPQQVL